MEERVGVVSFLAQTVGMEGNRMGMELEMGGAGTTIDDYPLEGRQPVFYITEHR